MRRLALFALAACATHARAQAQDPSSNRPSPIPTGIVPLPTGSPPTSLQAPVPPSIRQLPVGDLPLGWSPNFAAIKSYVAKQPLTLQDAVAVSLYTSRSFASAIANLQQVSARTGESRALLNPSATVNGQLPYYDQPTKASLGNSPPLLVLPQFNPVFTAALNLPIDVFGALRSAVSQAQFNEVAARIEVNRVRNQVVYDVKNAFYNTLRSSAQQAVASDNLNNALARLEDANKNYAAGTTSRFDITTAQRDVADAQQSLITARSQVSVSLAILKNTMGLDVTAKLSIQNDGAVGYPPGVLAPLVAPISADGRALSTSQAAATTSPDRQNPLTPKLAPPINIGDASPPEPGKQSPPLDPLQHNVVVDDFDFGPEYSSLMREALSNRPEVLEAEAQVTANRRGLLYARRSELPSFTLGLEDIYTVNATALERKNQEAITLGFSVPLFDGGLARARVREQRGLLAQAEVNRRQAQGQVLLDVQQAYIALVQARQRVAVANVEVSQARESYRVSRVRYRAGVSGQTGVSPQLELSNAQSSLAQAESNVVNALYDYNSARAQLDRATGRYGFSGFGPGYPSKSEIPTN